MECLKLSFHRTFSSTLFLFFLASITKFIYNFINCYIIISLIKIIEYTLFQIHKKMFTLKYFFFFNLFYLNNLLLSYILCLDYFHNIFLHYFQQSLMSLHHLQIHVLYFCKTLTILNNITYFDL